MKFILVPGTTFFGFVRYSARTPSPQTIPDVRIALEYLKPATVPALRPKMPAKFGPIFFLRDGPPDRDFFRSLEIRKLVTA